MTDGQDAAAHTSAVSNGAAWMGKLKQWWDQHSFYPNEASQTNKGGDVRVHILIAPDGQVTSIDMVQGSGSSVLDAAALAVFRNARLPPFPPGTPAQPADLVVTLHYHPADTSQSVAASQPQLPAWRHSLLQAAHKYEFTTAGRRPYLYWAGVSTYSKYPCR